MALVYRLDQKIALKFQGFMGAILFGPPKLLGLPDGIWTEKVITEGAENDLDAMRTNYIANRVRRNAIACMMFLSIPLCLLSVWAVSHKYSGFGFDKLIPVAEVASMVPDAVKPFLGLKVKSKGHLMAESHLAFYKKNCVGASDAVNRCINAGIEKMIAKVEVEWPLRPDLAPFIDDYVAAMRAGVK